MRRVCNKIPLSDKRKFARIKSSDLMQEMAHTAFFFSQCCLTRFGQPLFRLQGKSFRTRKASGCVASAHFGPTNMRGREWHPTAWKEPRGAIKSRSIYTGKETK
jgi:hypothetical protein